VSNSQMIRTEDNAYRDCGYDINEVHRQREMINQERRVVHAASGVTSGNTMLITSLYTTPYILKLNHYCGGCQAVWQS
jgi:fructose-1,6-bisphosphatase/sedoheptulose 1,7-bisphosphatase-like protein